MNTEISWKSRMMGDRAMRLLSLLAAQGTSAFHAAPPRRLAHDLRSAPVRCAVTGPLSGAMPSDFALPKGGKSVILFDGVYAQKEGSNLRLR